MCRLDGKFQMGGMTLKRRMSADDTRSGRPSSLTCVGVRKQSIGVSETTEDMHL
jgi:hypothetical protein